MIKSLVSKFYRQAPDSWAEAKPNLQSDAEVSQSGLFDPVFYGAQVNERLLSWDDAFRHFLDIGARKLLDPHPLFDMSFYVESNKDISFEQINPLMHFLRKGWREGRNPHPLVDIRYYLERYKDLEQLDVNPLSHFIFAGAVERRDPSPFFDSQKYLSQLSAEQAQSANLLIHFVTVGANQGLSPHAHFQRLFKIRSAGELVGLSSSSQMHYSKFGPINQFVPTGSPEMERNFGISVETLNNSRLYDAEFVSEQLGQSGQIRLDSVIQYLNEWSTKRLEPHVLFDTVFYVESNRDVDFQQINPFVHFLITGWKEGRNPHPLFDMAFYLKQSVDVRKAKVNPLQHFMVSGAQERRNPCRAFHSGQYLSLVMKTQKEEPENLLVHFLREGAAKNLRPHPLFDLVYEARKEIGAGPSPMAMPLAKFVPCEKLSAGGSERGKKIDELFMLFESGLFDHSFFLRQLGNEQLTWLESVTYYLENWREHDLDPHLFFDTSYYVESNSDVDFGSVNPLMHFAFQGWVESRNPHPLFDLDYYLKCNKDVRMGGRNPLLHFIRFGGQERRAFSPYFDYLRYEKALRKTSLCNFLKRRPYTGDRSSYTCGFKTREMERSRVEEPRNLLAHYLTKGVAEKLSPSSNFAFFFDVKAQHSRIGEECSHWQVIPRPLKAMIEDSSTYGSLARKLVNIKISKSKSFKLAQFIASVTFRKGAKEFLKGDSTVFLGTHEASRTGAPLLLLQLVKELAMRGWECVVLVDKEGEIESEYANYAHVIGLRGSRTKYQDLADYTDLLFEELQFPKPRLCLLNSLETGRFAKAFARHGVKIVTFVHEMADTYPVPYLKDVFEKSALVVFPAKCVQELARRKSKMSSLPDVVIPSALLDEDFGALNRQEARAKIRTELRVGDDALLVLACGSPDLRKGIDIFVSAAHHILNRLAGKQEVHFVWIGANRMVSHTPHYYALWDVRQSGLSSNIHLLPSRKDLRVPFRGADLFVLPSRQDPFPCVVHNAMAAELPVVTFQDGGGTPEMLIDGGAKIVPYGDVFGFADAVYDYLTNEGLRLNDGRRNAVLVRERFQFDRYIAKIEAALDLKLPPPAAT